MIYRLINGIIDGRATISPFGKPILVCVARLNKKTKTSARIEKILKNQLLKRVFDSYFDTVRILLIAFILNGWDLNLKGLNAK